MENAARLLMIFLIAGPPALCRAGMLVRCCESQAAQPLTAQPLTDTQLTGKVQATCCKSECRSGKPVGPTQIESINSELPTQEVPVEQEVPRNCEDCAAVCAGAFKPSDGSHSLVPTSPASSECICVFDATTMQSISPAGELANKRPSIPYPASDIPLRV